MDPKRIAVGQLSSDLEFVRELRDAVDQYFRAVDSWESAYRKYGQSGVDLMDEHHAYTAAYQRLMPLLSRARGLSFKFGLRDPWSGLRRTTLGRYAPHAHAPSALGWNERSAITDCLSRLMEACWESGQATPTARVPRSWLQRILDLFW